MSKPEYVLEPDPRRWYERVNVDAHVLMLQHDAAWCSIIADVSQGGCRILRPRDCHVQVNDFLKLYVATSEPGAVQPLEGRVARVSDRHIGVAFQSEQDPMRY